jgi:hypothetical protein
VVEYRAKAPWSDLKPERFSEAQRERRAVLALLRKRIRFYRSEDFGAMVSELEIIVKNIQTGAHRTQPKVRRG